MEDNKIFNDNNDLLIEVVQKLEGVIKNIKKEDESTAKQINEVITTINNIFFII